jgi:hypothetical protein
MGASTQDLINQIQLAQAQQTQPGFAGINAPPDPAKMQQFLVQLQQQQRAQQQQQYIDQVSRPTPGEWGFFHDAGRADMARAGQGIANLLGIGMPRAPSPAPSQAPQGPAYTFPSTQNAQASGNDAPQAAPGGSQAPDAPGAATQQALRAYQAMVTNGVDENTARTNATKMLTAAGVQNPADVLARASSGNATTGANAAPPVPIPNQGATPQQTIGNMLTAARAYNQSLIKSGIGADQAKVQTLTQMVNWGVPGADAELATAQTTLLNNQHVAGETTHNLAQARGQDANVLNQQDEIQNRAQQRGFDQQRINIELARLGIEQQKANVGTASTDLAAPPTPQELVIAQKMADGDMALPNPGSRAPKAARYAYLALQLNPDLTQESYGTRQTAAKAISSGPAGNQVRSFGVAYSHLDTVEQAVNALNNGDMPTFNRLANYVAVQTGSPAPTNVDTALSMIKGELAKGIVGSHAGEADRAAMLAGVNSNSSPQQILGASQMAKQLILGQASGLKSQYGSNVMGQHFDFNAGLPAKFKNDLSAYEVHQNGADQKPPAGGADGWTTMSNGVRVRVKQ